MDKAKADALAKLLGGYVWDSGGGINLVVIPRCDGKLIMISDECICEYEGDDPLEAEQPTNTIVLIGRPLKCDKRQDMGQSTSFIAEGTKLARSGYPSNVICPICRGIDRELDMCEYTNHDSTVRVEMCESCLDDFQQDTGINLGEMTPPADVFQRLHQWAIETAAYYKEHHMQRGRSC